MRFHAIQRSDPGIDDRFKQTRDDEPEQQFAEDHFDQLKKNIHDGLWSKGKMSKPAFNQRIWIALFGGLNRQIGFSCY